MRYLLSCTFNVLPYDEPPQLHTSWIKLFLSSQPWVPNPHLRCCFFLSCPFRRTSPAIVTLAFSVKMISFKNVLRSVVDERQNSPFPSTVSDIVSVDGGVNKGPDILDDIRALPAAENRQSEPGAMLEDNKDEGNSIASSELDAISSNKTQHFS